MTASKIQWPPIEFEELTWHRDIDEPRFVSKTARRRIASTYQAAVPLDIATREVQIPGALGRRIEDVSALMSRFDEAQIQRGYDLPALLLRSESAASSQIENLTSSVRNVALAELSDDIPQNAKIIAGNVAAMRTALSSGDDISVESIRSIHRALIDPTGQSFGGEIRDEQVWIGGTSYSPHGALFVPPQARRVPYYLEDIVAFAQREDIGTIAKAAIAHAQFETVHPFIDGNGRTGRALLHCILKSEGLLAHATLPVSAGLLHNIDAYMESLTRYQEGDPVGVIEQVIEALELALTLGELVSRRMDEVFAGWLDQVTERSGSSIYKLPTVLARQPVVNAAFIAHELGITQRAALNLLDRACEYEFVRPFGNRRRGAFYQCDELIDVLEQASSVQGVRRIIASGKIG